MRLGEVVQLNSGGQPFTVVDNVRSDFMGAKMVRIASMSSGGKAEELLVDSRSLTVFKGNKTPAHKPACG